MALHHLVHEGGWTLTKRPDRVITLVAPDGQIWFTGDTRDRPTSQPPTDQRSGTPPGRRRIAA